MKASEITHIKAEAAKLELQNGGADLEWLAEQVPVLLGEIERLQAQNERLLEAGEQMVEELMTHGLSR